MRTVSFSPTGAPTTTDSNGDSNSRGQRLTSTTGSTLSATDFPS